MPANPITLSILSRPPREKSGSKTSGRYDFQKNWTICKIIDLHAAQKNYLVICDYHEDVLIFDDIGDQNKASFVQVKTDENKSWTVTRLLKKVKGKSIIGKLLSNCDLGLEGIDGLIIASNAEFEFTNVTCKPKEELPFSALPEVDAQKIIKSVKGELGDKFSEEMSSLLIFSCSALSLQDNSTHTKGILAEFIEKRLPNRTFSVTPIYRTLFDEVRRKTSDDSTCSDFDTFVSKKGITRSLLEDSLALLASNQTSESTWQTVVGSLAQEGFAPLALNRIRRSWQIYDIKRTDYANISFQSVSKKLKNLSNSISREDENMSLKALINTCISSMTAAEINSLGGADILEAAILYETFN